MTDRTVNQELVEALKYIVKWNAKGDPEHWSAERARDLANAALARAEAATAKPALATEPHTCTLKGCKAATWVRHV